MPTPLRRTVDVTACDAWRAVGAAVLGAALSVSAAAAWGGEPVRAPIFQCEVNGKKLTSDRPIADCKEKEQRQLNSDGSLNRIVPPTPTPDELAAIEDKRRLADAERSARNDAVRRDRNLMQRFPTEAEHRAARAKALSDLRFQVRKSEERIAGLKVEQKKLDEERQFYVNDKVNKSLPPLLKQKIDANDAALEAQASIVQNQQTEVGRIDDLYDVELARLKKLWAGAPPGSLGPAPGPQQAVSTLPAKTSLK